MAVPFCVGERTSGHYHQYLVVRERGKWTAAEHFQMKIGAVQQGHSDFVIRHFFVIRASSFVI
jgi:hypothetical protein